MPTQVTRDAYNYIVSCISRYYYDYCNILRIVNTPDVGAADTLKNYIYRQWKNFPPTAFLDTVAFEKDGGFYLDTFRFNDIDFNEVLLALKGYYYGPHKRPTPPPPTGIKRIKNIFTKRGMISILKGILGIIKGIVCFILIVAAIFLVLAVVLRLLILGHL